MQSLNELVEDWAGFEELIRTLHDTGTVTVQRNVTLPGKSGAPRQIDVLVTHTEGLYTHRILIECKHWKSPVKRQQVDAMVAAIADLKASKGVFFTTKGYQSGAETMAAAHGIDCFVVREIADAEWGAPGRRINLMLQVVQRSIGKLSFQIVGSNLSAGSAADMGIHLAVGAGGFTSLTPVRIGERPDTLEDVLERAATRALDRLTANVVTFNDRADCTVHLGDRVKVEFPALMAIKRLDGGELLCSALECELVLRIRQSNLHYDRAEQYLFALAVENCVDGVVYAASRRKGSDTSSLRPLPSLAVEPPAGAVQPGQVLRVVMRSYFDFAEVAALNPVAPSQQLAEALGISEPVAPAEGAVAGSRTPGTDPSAPPT